MSMPSDTPGEMPRDKPEDLERFLRSEVAQNRSAQRANTNQSTESTNRTVQAMKTVANVGWKAAKFGGRVVAKPIKFTAGLGVGAVKKSFNIFFFLLLLIIHYFDAYQFEFGMPYLVRFTVYFMLFLFGLLVVFKVGSNPGQWGPGIKVCGALSLASFALPYLIDYASGSIKAFLLPFITLVPLWAMAYLWFLSGDMSGTKTVVTVAYIILVSLLILPAIEDIAKSLNLDKDIQNLQVQTTVKAFFTSWLDRIKGFFGSLVGSLKDRALKKYNETVNFGAYEATVDKNVAAPLGVNLDNVELTSDKIERGQNIDVVGRITVNSIGEETDNKIPIDLKCEAQKSGETKNPIAGIITPKDRLELYNLEQEDIECKIAGYQVDVGSYKVKILSSYDFETFSYMITYFVNRLTLRDLRKSKLDFFTFYKISDRTPNAKSTNGPIKVSIKLVDPPIPVDALESSSPLLSVKIDNIASGVIKNLNSLVIGIPQPLTIDPASCNYPFEQVSSPPGLSDADSYNYYSLSSEAMKRKALESIKTHRFECRMKIDGQNSNQLLNNNPYVVKSIRVAVKYKYETTKEVNVDIKKPEGFVVSIIPKPATSGDELACEASHSQKKLGYIFYKVAVGDKIDPNAKETRLDQCIDGICKLRITKDMVSGGVKRGDTVQCYMRDDETQESDTVAVKIQNYKPTVNKEGVKIVGKYEGSQVSISSFSIYDADDQDASFSVSADITRIRSGDRSLVAQATAVCAKKVPCTITAPLSSELVQANDRLEAQLYVGEQEYFAGQELSKIDPPVVIDITATNVNPLPST